MSKAIAHRTDRDEIVWIKEHSGLTWDQLGKVFGVSRRAVHMWANGGRLNEANAQRLREFASIIERLEAETPGATPETIRARLNQIEADGYSIVGRLRQERSGGPSWGAPFGPERLVDAIRGPLHEPTESFAGINFLRSDEQPFEHDSVQLQCDNGSPPDLDDNDSEDYVIEDDPYDPRKVQG